MSLRSALIAAILLTAVVTVLFTGVAGLVGVSHRVEQEAQRRVNHDLKIARAFYRHGVEDTARLLTSALSHARLVTLRQKGALAALRKRLGFTILNLCAADGTPLAGSYRGNSAPVAVRDDPVLRRALGGQGSSGTIAMDKERLIAEAGSHLVQSLTVTADDGRWAPALFWWAAEPLVDEQGRVVALLYGGKALSRNVALVDMLQRLTFGRGRFEGKPLGTVTVFAHDIRVATNVLGPRGRRAVGTRVSQEVSQQVLAGGARWQARAFVVDRWYLSAYEPLVDPDGKILGMLYVGLLEGPYSHARMQRMLQLGGVVVAILAIALLVGWLVVRRITQPLATLSGAVGAITTGDLDHALPKVSSYSELRALQASMETMRQALQDRDLHLREKNAELELTNEQLAHANSNYMQTLAFVTHELKSPLAAMQSLIDLVVDGYMGKVPERSEKTLVRVKRNCEDLQDMVKNYLDLTRAERGEIQARLEPLDFIEAVVAPCVQQAQPLFVSRNVSLEVEAPEQALLQGDAELLRIALSNYLSNAAKYAHDEGKAQLEVSQDNGTLEIVVWNEGAGFSEPERGKLFQKFSRLRNANTRDKRGSGLGLFLCQDIVKQHGGEVWAESEPGLWARFGMRLPSRG